MWCVVSVINREIMNDGTFNTKKEAGDYIYKELCVMAGSEGNLIDMINAGNAGFSYNFSKDEAKAWITLDDGELEIDFKAIKIN